MKNNQQNQNFLAVITFQEDDECWTETHLFSTDDEYPTVTAVLTEGVIQGDFSVESRQSQDADVINAEFEAFCK
jgi:hypothetical protein